MRLGRAVSLSLALAASGCGDNAQPADMKPADAAVADLASGPDLAPAAAPTITAVTPSHQASTFTTPVKITGTNFVAGAAVWFGAKQVDAKAVFFTSSSEIDSAVPAPSPAGAVDVKVVNPDGQSAVLPRGYTYDYSQLSFAMPKAQASGLLTPPAGLVVDLDKDGRSDLVLVSAFSSAISVLRGMADGTLGVATKLDEGQKPTSLAAGDFNGDGWIDIATLEPIADQIGVRLNDGKGALGPLTTVALPAKSGAASLTAGDFNGDKKLDLAVCLGKGLNVTVLLGDGTGKFAAAKPAPLVGPFPGKIVAGQFDAAPALDVALVDGQSTFVSWLAGAGDGTLGAENRFDAAMPIGDFFVADLDGNGFDDIILPPPDKTGLRLYMNSKTGFTLAAAPALPGKRAAYVTTAHVTIDSKLDLAIADDVENFIHIVGPDAIGGWAKAIDVNIVTGVSWIGTGDFNGDGLADFVSLSFSENSSDVQLMINTAH